MKNEIGKRENQKSERKRKPTIGRERDRSIAKTYRWEEMRKPSSLVLPKRVGEMRREQLPEVAGRESGREKKRELGREKKIEAGRETVTNITYITIQISSKYHKIEVVMNVYRRVKSEEKRASPNLFYYVYR